MNGVFLALVAVVGWGFADFYAQKAARKIGVAGTLFAGAVLGLVVLAPFAAGDLPTALADRRQAAILILSAILGLFTALFNLEAYRRGKIAVVEPILGLELPVTILLAVALHGERLSLAEMLSMAAVFCGILLAATIKAPDLRLKNGGLERGVLLGLAGAIGLGATNFITGVASQETSPVMAIWFGRAAFTLIFGAYLLASRKLVAEMRIILAHGPLALGVSTLYLIAFLAFATATTLMPISIVTTISETYIVLAVLLGIFVGKEKLARHQLAGAAIAVAGILVLAYVAA